MFQLNVVAANMRDRLYAIKLVKMDIMFEGIQAILTSLQGQLF